MGANPLLLRLPTCALIQALNLARRAGAVVATFSTAVNVAWQQARTQLITRELFMRATEDVFLGSAEAASRDKLRAWWAGTRMAKKKAFMAAVAQKRTSADLTA